MACGSRCARLRDRSVLRKGFGTASRMSPSCSLRCASLTSLGPFGVAGTPRVTGVATRSDPVDARADRVVQGAIAVVTLGAFVFRAIWVIPVLAVLVGLGAAAGPAGNVLHRLFAEVAGPRLSPALATVPAATVRAQDGLAVGAVRLRDALLVGLPQRNRVGRRPRGRRGGRGCRDHTGSPRGDAARPVHAPLTRGARQQHRTRRDHTEQGDEADGGADRRAAPRIADREHGERERAPRCARSRLPRRAASPAPAPKHAHGTFRACARTSAPVNTTSRTTATIPGTGLHHATSATATPSSIDRQPRRHRRGDPVTRDGVQLPSDFGTRPQLRAGRRAQHGGEHQPGRERDRRVDHVELGSALEAAVPAAVEQQRPALVPVAELDARGPRRSRGRRRRARPSVSQSTNARASSRTGAPVRPGEYATRARIGRHPSPRTGGTPPRRPRRGCWPPTCPRPGCAATSSTTSRRRTARAAVRATPT